MPMSGVGRVGDNDLISEMVTGRQTFAAGGAQPRLRALCGLHWRRLLVGCRHQDQRSVQCQLAAIQLLIWSV